MEDGRHWLNYTHCFYIIIIIYVFLLFVCLRSFPFLRVCCLFYLPFGFFHPFLLFFLCMCVVRSDKCSRCVAPAHQIRLSCCSSTSDMMMTVTTDCKVLTRADDDGDDDDCRFIMHTTHTRMNMIWLAYASRFAFSIANWNAMGLILLLLVHHKQVGFLAENSSGPNELEQNNWCGAWENGSRKHYHMPQQRCRHHRQFI